MQDESLDCSYLHIESLCRVLGTKPSHPAASHVAFWAKDFGGSTTVTVKYYMDMGWFEQLVLTQTLKVPLDGDNDGLADKWERARLEDWNMQFGATLSIQPSELSPNSDPEWKDPDKDVGIFSFTDVNEPGVPNRDMPEHGSPGDGRTSFQEYRGYILDGGGFDWSGANGHNSGHGRLNPAYKELLIEVDAMANVAHMPDRAGVAAWMDEVSKGMSKAVDGAGIRMYYIVQDMATPHDQFTALLNTVASQKAFLGDYVRGGNGKPVQRHVDLQRTGFTHLQLIDTKGPWDSSGFGWNDDTGAFVAIDTTRDHATYFKIPWSQYAVATISHELHHTLSGGDHYDDPDGDATLSELNDQMRILYKYSLFPMAARALVHDVMPGDTTIQVVDSLERP